MLEKDTLNILNEMRWKESPEEKAKLIQSLLPWVNMIAASFYKKYRSSGMLDFADYMHASLLGVFCALERFSPNKGDFCAYCYKYMKGEVLSMMVHPTDISEGMISIDNRVKDINQLTGGNEHQNYHYATIGALLEPEIISGIAKNEGDISVLKNNLKELVSRLEYNPRCILEYHYYYSVPFKDISTILGLSPARVSQLHKEALTKLKNRIDGEEAIYA